MTHAGSATHMALRTGLLAAACIAAGAGCGFAAPLLARAALPLAAALTAGVAILAFWETRRRAGRVLALRQALADCTAAAVHGTTRTEACNSLDRNFNALRDSLYAHGQPARDGQTLRFGNRTMNGRFDEVDRLAQTGAVATIFCGDSRIATNVPGPDGGRAIGTRLAGPACEAVLNRGLSFRGTADILGAPHLTIYEPILQDGAVIGALFVGVPEQKFTDEIGRLRDRVMAPADPWSGLTEAVSVLDNAAAAQNAAQTESAAIGNAAHDARCIAAASLQRAAMAQRTVLTALTGGLARLKQGDLVSQLGIGFAAEYEALRADFNAAVTGLQQTMQAISASTGGIATGTDEIAQAADDLARRTEHQAANLEQTAVALDAMTRSVRKSAEGTAQARSVVAAARQYADRSASIVQRTMDAVNGIEQSSKQIVRIIGVIDEIAFQTNLLALNAGVEAARAGDAGRGFAVIATEVRALAQRSAEAAREINGLVSQSTTHVAQGVALVGQTGASLLQIVAQVAQIQDLIERIAKAAEEQAKGLAEVNSAITEMDQVTQKNAAMVEQSTAACHSLSRETSQLSALVGRFKVEAANTRPAAGLRTVGRRGGALPRPANEI